MARYLKKNRLEKNDKLSAGKRITGAIGEIQGGMYP